MKKSLLALLLFFNVIVGHSQTHWKVQSSSVTFKIKNAGLTVDGSFGEVTADIRFSELHYTEASIEASVKVKTISTGIDLRNNHMKKEEYFNEAIYPEIRLKSTLFSKEKSGIFKSFLKLTMKGITKDVIIPFTYVETGNNAVFKASFVINRRDYNVGGNSWTMSDNATVNVVVNVIK